MSSRAAVGVRAGRRTERPLTGMERGCPLLEGKPGAVGDALATTGRAQQAVGPPRKGGPGHR